MSDKNEKITDDFKKALIGPYYTKKDIKYCCECSWFEYKDIDDGEGGKCKAYPAVARSEYIHWVEGYEEACSVGRHAAKLRYILWKHNIDRFTLEKEE